ncbi:MAG: DUF3391 domain-containing protein [bacterium]|jgi:HD-GYP domain-containing protein (c-di-GMP phosphodiesterase class II)|nr:DUF3391 domain-containing protein [bacterium]
MTGLQKVSVKDLRAGHFIVLPPPWHKHPFLRNRFLLRKTEDVERLSKAGIHQVLVDPGRSVVPLPAGQPLTPLKQTKTYIAPPREWDQNKLITEEFRELIRNERLPAPVKARAVQRASIEQMKQLMSEPTAARLAEYKTGLADLVDVVMSDDALASSLLRITTHDFYTWTHSVNVGTLSLLFARFLFKQSDAHDMHELAAGFFLHDIGKTRIPSELLNKRGRFDDREVSEMRCHVARGLAIVEETQVLSAEAVVIVAQHHERVDGSGYPNGLKGDEIHLYAAICSLADVYDALTSVRPYKTSVSPYQALRIIQREMVNEHNRETFDSFVRLFE